RAVPEFCRFDGPPGRMGGEAPGLGEYFFDAHHDGRAADGRGATAVGVPTVVRGRRVATHHDDVFDGHAQPVGSDLGEAGLLSLTVRRRPGDDRDLGGHFNAHTAPFP